MVSMEMFGSNPEKEIKKALEQSLVSTISEKVSDTIEKEGLVQAVKEHLTKLNIKPVFLTEKENPEKFAEMRYKLNNERGIIIANHPGFFDHFSILSILERDDVKILVSKNSYKMLSSILDDNILIEAKGHGNTLTEMRSMLDTIKNHIDKGGVVVIFPTGGSDKVDLEKQNITFQEGLAVIIKNVLQPTDMVYSFNINSNDVKSIVDEKLDRNISSALSYKLGDSLNPNAYKETKEIGVKEVYSQASDWKEILDNVDKKERSGALTDFFYEQF